MKSFCLAIVAWSLLSCHSKSLKVFEVPAVPGQKTSSGKSLEEAPRLLSRRGYDVYFSEPVLKAKEVKVFQVSAPKISKVRDLKTAQNRKVFSSAKVSHFAEKIPVVSAFDPKKINFSKSLVLDGQSFVKAQKLPVKPVCEVVPEDRNLASTEMSLLEGGTDYYYWFWGLLFHHIAFCLVVLFRKKRRTA